MKLRLLTVLFTLLVATAHAQPFSAQIEAARGRHKLYTTAQLPATCAPGTEVFDTTVEETKVCLNDGVTWQTAGGGGGGTITAGTTPIAGCGPGQVLFEDAAGGGTVACSSGIEVPSVGPPPSLSVGGTGAGTGNAIHIGDIPGCIAFEGVTGDAAELFLCPGDVTADVTLTIDSPAGDPSAPRIKAATSQGLYLASNNAGAYLYLASNSNYVALSGFAFQRMGSGMQLAFSNNASGDAGALDIGLARSAAGIGIITDGSTGVGQLLQAGPVTPNTGTLNLTAVMSGLTVTNTGDGDGSAVGLLNDPGIGLWYRVAVTAAQTITITAAAGETLKFGSSTCGTSLTSNTVGSAVTIQAVTAGSGAIWITTATTGTWTCNA